MFYVVFFILSLFLMAIAVKMHKETSPNGLGGGGMIFLIRFVMIVASAIAVACLSGFFLDK